MKSLVAALQFLTICPGRGHVSCDARQIGRSVAWFPVIGLMVGAAVAVLDLGAMHLFGPLVASVIAMIALLAVSGGLHADGLADTGDGFLSARPQAKIMEIMRDSRIGAMGLLLVVSVFALKCAALASVPVCQRWQTLVLIGLTGRCSMVLQLSMLPYARPDGGLCTVFVSHRRPRDPWLTGIACALTCWALTAGQGLAVAATAMLTLWAFTRWCHQKIGGFTGDTLGAGCEITELIPALVGVAWNRIS
jgi:adenosylcobinamide-GDP ribazoletransferase